MTEIKKILLLVEGEKVEKELFSHVYKLYGIDNIEIVAYRTNIYALYHRLLKDYSINGEIDFEVIDIPLFLNDYFNLQQDDILNESDFSDIILIFDFDPHDPNYSSKKLMLLIENFSESSDKGMLYINYPMIESYKDLSQIDDEEFLTSTVHMSDLQKRSKGSSYYKRQVESKTFIKNIESIDKVIMTGLMDIHTRKIKNILPSATDELDILKDFCEIQCEKLEKDNNLWIVNTSILHMSLEYGKLTP